MRTVTLQELNAFSEAIARVREVCGRLGPMSRAVPKIMAANNSSDGLSFGVKRLQAMTAERDEMFRQFERAAHNFLGEGKKQEETLEDYFTRICMMSQDEILAAPTRNGLELRL